MIEITLPYPPSVNTYWRHIAIKGKPRTLISASGRDYVKQVCQDIGHGIGALSSRLSVEIEAYMPDRRVRDLDNCLKVALDSLTKAGVWADDGQIDRLLIIRAGIQAPGKLIVRITKITEGKEC